MKCRICNNTNIGRRVKENDHIVLSELDTLWTETLGDPKICIAVIDGPVDLSHPCFHGARLSQLKTHLSAAADQGPASQHGTHVASVIFGQMGSPVRGISPGCRGLIVPVFADGPDGALAPCSQIDLAHAITQSVEQGAHVINISGGELASSNEPHPLLAKAVRFCADNGVLIVAAAGNDGCQCLHVPAAMPSTLAVGAMDARGLPLDSSNWGGAYLTNGILASGEKIRGALPGGGVNAKSGTSFATPIVSGIVALLLSIQIKRGNKPDHHDVRAAILQSAHPCSRTEAIDCRRHLVGRLNVVGAYNLITGKNLKATEKTNTLLQVQGTASVGPMESTNQLPVLGVQTAELTVPGSEMATLSPQRSTVEAMRALENAVSIEPNQPASEMDKESTNQKKEEKMHESRDNTYDGPEKTLPQAPASGVQATESPITDREEAKSYDGSEKITPQAPASGAQATVSAIADREVAALPPMSSTAAAIPTMENRPSVMPNQVHPAQEVAESSLVYALGMVGCDFGTEARRDSFVQSMEGTSPNPDDPTQLLAHLEANPEYAASLIWTLELETTAIYAIVPAGPFTSIAYNRLREFRKAQLTEGVERVSIPGVIGGNTRLLSGQVVPVIVPEQRGMYSWSTAALVKAAVGKPPQGVDEAGVHNFLERVYYELMNLGRTAPDRAMNFAATNAFQVAAVFKDAAKAKLMLDHIEAERSSICRPESDCWDVMLTFFDPANRLTVARKVYRFTVDVSDVVPVTVGTVRSWAVY